MIERSTKLDLSDTYLLALGLSMFIKNSREIEIEFHNHLNE